MNDRKKPDARQPDPVPAAPDSREKKAQARPYVPPSIETFSGQQILQEIGPAQGYSGTVGGVDSPF